MSDLISRQAVIKIIEGIKSDGNIPKNYGTLLDIARAIRSIPTAFDVDKVAIEISDYFQSYIRNCNLTEEDALTILYMEEHITNIVKGAVNDEYISSNNYNSISNNPNN